MAAPLRLVSFNILQGLRPGLGAVRERRSLDRARLDAAGAVVASLDPDILVLNEALYCCEHDAQMVDYAGLFGFPAAAAALYDGAWGNVILSRYAIRVTREWAIPERGALAALIDTPAGRLTVATYHPHPHRPPELKAHDFGLMAADLAGPAVICGDLNCISPQDEVDRARLVRSFQAFSAEAETAVDRFIESGVQVFARLADLGFRDAVPLSGRRYSIPTDLINSDKASGMRIDHILANRGVEVTGGEVVHSAASNRASDHHPVTVAFMLAD